MEEEIKLSEQCELQEVKSRIESNGMKKPIFIGTPELECVKLIKDTINQEDYEVLQLTPELFQKLYEQYLFNLLSIEEQKRQKEILENKEYKERATNEAMLLQTMLTNCSNKQGEEKFTFTQSELKSLFKKSGKNISHRDVWNLIDFLALHDYVIVSEQGLNKNKTKFKLVITYQSQIEMLSIKNAHLQNELAKVNEQIRINNNLIQVINDKIENDNI